MSTKQIKITVKGITPLLMHAFPLQPPEKIEKLSMEEQAEWAAYRDVETKGLYVPSIAVQRGLINGAAYSKGKGRASLQKVAAACLFVFPERIPLNQNNYIIDQRAVVIPATRGRIIRYRPRLDEWQITFEIEYDPLLLTEKQLRQIVDDWCSKVGLLDFRPEKKGPFGRGMVTEWNSKKA